MTTTTDLVVAGRSLVVLDQIPDLVEYSIDIQLKLLNEEIQQLMDKVDGLERSMGAVLHTMAFRYPELSEKLRRKLNKLAELRGDRPIPPKTDPLSRRAEDGTKEEEEAANIEREAQEEVERLMQETPDDELPEKLRKAKLKTRMMREKCKKFYLKIAQKTHPDKSKDKELNTVFVTAKQAYDNLDLDVLKQVFKDVQAYLKLKGNKRSFRQFRASKLEQKKSQKLQLEGTVKAIERGMAYQCLQAANKNDPVESRIAYQDFIEQQCFLVDDAIEAERAAFYMQRRSQHSSEGSFFYRED